MRAAIIKMQPNAATDDIEHSIAIVSPSCWPTFEVASVSENKIRINTTSRLVKFLETGMRHERI